MLGFSARNAAPGPPGGVAQDVVVAVHPLDLGRAETSGRPAPSRPAPGRPAGGERHPGPRPPRARATSRRRVSPDTPSPSSPPCTSVPCLPLPPPAPRARKPYNRERLAAGPPRHATTTPGAVMPTYPASETERRVDAVALGQLVGAVFRHSGMRPNDAALLADTLVTADRRGCTPTACCASRSTCASSPGASTPRGARRWCARWGPAWW